MVGLAYDPEVMMRNPPAQDWDPPDYLVGHMEEYLRLINQHIGGNDGEEGAVA
jgi:hypothetical protein